MHIYTAATKKCPFCAEDIQADALKCKHCKEYLDPILRAKHERKETVPPPAYQKWNPALAAILSFFFPGVGQMYKGEIGAGIAWFFGTVLGYVFLIIPGIIIHILCILNAASGDPYK